MTILKNVQFVVNQAPSCDLLMVKISNQAIQQKERCFAFTSSNSSRKSTPENQHLIGLSRTPETPCPPTAPATRKRDSTKKESAPITLALSVQSFWSSNALTDSNKFVLDQKSTANLTPPSPTALCISPLQTQLTSPNIFPFSVYFPTQPSQCPPNQFSKLTARPSSTTTSHAHLSSDLLLSQKLEYITLLPSSPRSTSLKTRTCQQCSTRQRPPTHGYLLPA